MRLPLKMRLTLSYVLMFAVIVGVWSVFVVVLVRADLYAGVDRELGSRVSQIASTLGSSRDTKFQDVSDAALTGVPRTEAAAQLLSADGRVLASSGDVVAARPIVSAAWLAEVSGTRRAKRATVADGGETFRVLVVPAPSSADLILVGTSTEAADASMRRLMLVMLLTGPLALIAAGVGGWLLARRALRPVAEMNSTAASVGIDRLDERVPVPEAGDELTDLANTLNSMLSRLEAGVQDKRRLVADASHELQTPLAVMRTELDVSLASTGLPAEAVEVLESAREETDRMTRIVRNLLTLARFDEGTLRLLPKPVDLADIALEVVEALSGLAGHSGVTVRQDLQPAVIDGDVEYLRLVATNLIENAIKYSGRGATVDVTTGREADCMTLVVKDTGPGMPPEATSRIFDRFYRIDGARSKQLGGSGLGLAITKEIVEAHGAKIELESKLGEGSRFAVCFPTAQ